MHRSFKRAKCLRGNFNPPSHCDRSMPRAPTVMHLFDQCALYCTRRVDRYILIRLTTQSSNEPKGETMKRSIIAALFVATMCGTYAFAQVKQTKDQIMFYTADWHGDRFPDGRPKVSDDLLKRSLDVSIEDIWDFLRARGYENQFEGNWMALHIEKPVSGRALTTQYMPTRPDVAKAEAAEGKAEGRIAFYRGYDPSGWRSEQLTYINCPIRSGHAVVLPGDLVIAKAQGIIFVPAILAEDAISSAEFTNLMDAYNFELNKAGKNGGQFEGGWNAQKFAGFKEWVAGHPDQLKMTQEQFTKLLTERQERMARRSAAPASSVSPTVP